MGPHIRRRVMLWLCSLVLAIAPARGLVAGENTFSFGVVPQFDAIALQATWQPLLDAIEAQSGIRLELKTSPGIPQFEQALLSGDFDFAYMNPYHFVKAYKTNGYVPLVRDIGRGLQGIVVVRTDSPIREARELDGQRVAFPAPNALGASLIPRAQFSEAFKINILPVYVRSHSSVYLNVVTGETLAGGGVYSTLQEQPAAVRDALRVIYETPQVAPHPVAAHPRVPGAVQEQLAAAFLQLGETTKGRELLAGIPVKTVGRATLADYESLRKMGLEKYYEQ